MVINKVIVPETVGDGVGQLNYRDGRLVSYEHGSVVNVYLFHEQDGEHVRAMEITMPMPMTYDKCLNAAEMAAYGLETAMDVASFGAALARKQRNGEDLEAVTEHDRFMERVKQELAVLGIGGSVVSELERAKMVKLMELEAYDTSTAVNGFTLGGQTMWLTRDERTQIDESINAYEATGATSMTKYFGGVPYTFTLALWKQMLNALIVYASEALNVTEGHKAAINSLHTVNEVEEYDFTVGYPQKLSF